MKEIIGCIVVLVMLGVSSWIFVSVIDFFISVPKQLKRIADALEKRNKDA